jgi:hypothetical protein
MNDSATKPKARDLSGVVSHLRLFAFSIAALLFFCGGLYFWPTAIRGHLMQASIALRMEQPGAASTQFPTRNDQNAARDAVLSAAVLRTALSQVGAPPNVERNADLPFPTDSEIEFVTRNLSIGRDSASDEAGRLLLSYLGHDSAWSTAFLDRLAGETVAELDRRAAEAIALAMASQRESPLALAERKEEAARAALDGFLSRHFDALNDAGTAATSPKSAGPSTASQQPAPFAPPKINPKWQSLEERLAAETAKRDQLLLDRLPEHPQVREADARIEALNKQLDQTPKFETGEPPATSGNSATTDKMWGEVQPAEFAQDTPGIGFVLVPEVGEEYERLLGELSAARAARKAAEREAASRAFSESARPVATVLRGKIVSNARLAQTLRHGPSTGRLTVLALASIFAGACVAAMIRIPRKLQTYSTAAEVEEDLALPVVAVVPSAPPSSAVVSR